MHADRNIPITALPNNTHAKNQDHTIPSLPRGTRVVADDAMIDPMSQGTPRTQRKKEHVHETLWHTLAGNADKIYKIRKATCY